MFIDKVNIIVKAGNGGNGCTSLYRDTITRYGRPDGGDGGNGGNVIVKASRNVYTLLDFKFRQEFIAKNGRHGSGKLKKGKDADDIVLLVPIGTQVIEKPTGCLLDDLTIEDQEVVVVYGGKGGRGNHTKKEALPGEVGQSRQIILDLKLIADVGIIGFPNAGKSTLISAISRAKPKIAPYPFTTKEPVLGVVAAGDATFTIADIPGLIEGAHSGRGLGIDFLRHVERTRLLVHLIDMAAQDTRDPVLDFHSLNKELELYSKDVALKPQIIVANKMDCESAKDNLLRFKQEIKNKVIEISAKEKTNLNSLIHEITEELQKNSC